MLFKLTYVMCLLALATVPLALAQQQPQIEAAVGPQEELYDRRMIVIEGTVVPARSVTTPDGQVVQVPEACRIQLVLPAEEDELHYHPQPDPRIDKQTGKCQQAVEVSITADAWKRKHGKKKSASSDKRNAFTNSYAWQRTWWTDPPGLNVNEGKNELWWSWDPSQYASFTGGSYYEWWEWRTAWVLWNTHEGQLTWDPDDFSKVGYHGDLLVSNPAFPGCQPPWPPCFCEHSSNLIGDKNGNVTYDGYTTSYGGPGRFLLSPHITQGRIN